MPDQIAAALIGAAATVLASLIEAWAKKAPKDARPYKPKHLRGL